MKECPVCHRCREDRHRFCAEDGARLEIVFAGSPVLDGKYSLLLRLGIGGMGRVYKARHLGIKRLVAVKIPHPGRRAGEQPLARFRREAEALGRLTHPNVVRVTDFGIEQDRQIPYLVMSYLEGTTLAARLRNGPLPPAEALPIFEQIAAALDHAHRAGVLHRDLKPANVFLREGGPADAPQVEVLDFGLSRFFADPEATPVLTPDAELEAPTAPCPTTAAGDAAEPDITVTEPLLGTPGYLAPEVLAGAAPAVAADLYAFGALIRATLSGQPATASGDLESPLAPPIQTALSTDAAARPTSAAQVVAELRQALRAIDQGNRLRRDGPRRVALGMLLGLFAAIIAASLERPLEPFEHRLVDARFALAPLRPPSHPLILVAIDDETIAADSRPLSEKGDEMGTLLHQVFDAGAVGVGIDLLLPAHWGRSGAFVDLVLHHSGALVLAAFSPPDGPVVGPEAVAGLITAGLGPDRTERLFGFVNLGEERDGVVRRAFLRFRDVQGIDRPAFAARLVQLLVDSSREPGVPAPLQTERLWIDFTLDWRLFEQISWRDLPKVLRERPGLFRGRLVLIGATYTASGDGPYRIPHRTELPGTITGPFLQALIAASVLDDSPLQPAARPWWLAAAAWLVAASSTWILLTRRATLARIASLVIALGGGWSAAAFVLFLRHHLLLAVAPFVGALSIATTVAVLVRNRLTRIQERNP